MNMNEIPEEPDVFSSFPNESDWKLAPLGETATQFLSLFYCFASTGPIRTVIRTRNKDSNNIFLTLISYVFHDQILMAIVFGLGLLCAVLLLLMPFLIMLYRNKQISASEELGFFRSRFIVSPKRGWNIFEYLIAFFSLAVFGGFIMCFSMNELRNNIPKAFDFGVLTIDIAYEHKEKTRDIFHYNVFDISRNALETIQRMYGVNEEVNEKFMNEIYLRLKPVRFLMQSIQWDVKAVETSLISMVKSLENFTRHADQRIPELTKNYLDTLTKLKEVFEKENASETFGAVIDPLFEIPTYSFNATFEDYNKTIERLGEVSKLNVQGDLQNITRFFRDETVSITYDPSEVAEELKQISFDTKMYIRNNIGEYLVYLERYFTKQMKQQSLADIESTRVIVLGNFKPMYVATFLFGILSILLGIVFFTFFSLGIWGTKGFRIDFPFLRGYKSIHSDRGGKVIVVSVYITVIFLSCFWTLSIMLFITSAIPLELCFSLRDKSLFHAGIQIFETVGESQWFPKLLNFLKEHFTQCEKDPTYSKYLPDPLVNHSSFDNVKTNMDMESINKVVRDAFQDVPDMNNSQPKISGLNFSDIVNSDFHSYFRNLETFTEELNPKNASSVLKNIKSQPSSSGVLRSAAQAALTSFQALIIECSNSLRNEHSFNISFNALNVSLITIESHVDDFKISSEALADFLKQNVSNLYVSVLTETIIKNIDTVERNLNESTISFRRSLSVCSDLILFYNQFLLITCGQILDPFSNSWMGSFFVDIFLLLLALLCLYAAPLFLKPLKEIVYTPGLVIHPETMPSCEEPVTDLEEAPESTDVESPAFNTEGKFCDTSDEKELLPGFKKRSDGNSSGLKNLKSKFTDTQEKSVNFAKEEIEEKISLADILESHRFQKKDLQDAKKYASASKPSVVNSRTKNLNKELVVEDAQENAARVKNAKSLIETLQHHAKTVLEKNDKIDLNSLTLNDSDIPEKTESLIDEQNIGDVTESKSLLGVLRSHSNKTKKEYPNKNFIPISKAPTNASSSKAVDTSNTESIVKNKYELS